MNAREEFLKEYGKLNKAQKEAVDTIDGPVMVVAGPGTGKTQVLALRIANILARTDTPADGILCLTFTNSGVRAMRERLTRLIGTDASRVTISTFHSFAGVILEEFFEHLGLPEAPTLLDEKEVILIVDELLEKNDWEYLRTRSGGSHNFRDIKSLISLLKRERMSPEDFDIEIQADIKRITNDPESISSRGPTKGQLKQAVQEKLNRLERTREVVKFYELYENKKREENLADYDDMLELLVRLVKNSDDARDTLRERFLYVLVDEHQDSSGVQNEFLESLFGDVEKPNVFVVGDDRQLIYGFGGASLSQFEKFRETFSNTKLIALTENYRSTQTILDSADALLTSSIVQAKLTGKKDGLPHISLVEAEYPRDEIIRAGIFFENQIKNGAQPEACVLLVPKNAQVKMAMTVLSDLGLSVSRGEKTSLFELREAQSFLAVLRVLENPYSAPYVADLLLDSISGIPPLIAHTYIGEFRFRLSVEQLGQEYTEIAELKKVLLTLLQSAQKKDIYGLIQEIGERLFFEKEKEYDAFVREVEVVRTLLEFARVFVEKSAYKKMHGAKQLTAFVGFIDRLIEYGQDIEIASLDKDVGIKVMTLHASKGLEFPYVWIAHMDENSLMKGKHMAFTLPESIAEKVAKKDELSARRELYVAITRAKEECTISYARTNYQGGEQSIARIVAELPEQLIEKKSARDTEEVIVQRGIKTYVERTQEQNTNTLVEEIQDHVARTYSKRHVAVTHLNNFFTCPWTWYFRNFISLPEPENESAQFGSLVHGALEEVFKNREVSIDELGIYFEKTLDRLRIYDEIVRARFVRDAKQTVSTYIQNDLPEVLPRVQSEKEPKEYSDPIAPELTLTGKIDLIEFENDTVVRVTDFKTNQKPEKKSAIEKEDEEGRMSTMLRQLAMYSYLLLHDKNSMAVTSSKLLFLEAEVGDKDRIYETTITKEHIEKLRKDIHDYATFLQSGEWITRPCRAKKYGTKECRYCELAKRIIV